MTDPDAASATASHFTSTTSHKHFTRKDKGDASFPWFYALPHLSTLASPSPPQRQHINPTWALINTTTQQTYTTTTLHNLNYTQCCVNSCKHGCAVLIHSVSAARRRAEIRRRRTTAHHNTAHRLHSRVPVRRKLHLQVGIPFILLLLS